MKKLLILFMCLICVTLCSCKEKEVSSETEFPNYSYVGENKNGSMIRLSFTENKAIISMNSKDYSGEIKGFYALTKDELFVIDDVSGIKYNFKYSLTGDKVILSYNGYKNVLLKDDNK
ncbi:MAG: hypothetical protein ACI4QE_00805 [Acutalibacteraceae bacterium]